LGECLLGSDAMETDYSDACGFIPTSAGLIQLV